MENLAKSLQELHNTCEKAMTALSGNAKGADAYCNANDTMIDNFAHKLDPRDAAGLIKADKNLFTAVSDNADKIKEALNKDIGNSKTATTQQIGKSITDVANILENDPKFMANKLDAYYVKQLQTFKQPMAQELHTLMQNDNAHAPGK